MNSNTQRIVRDTLANVVLNTANRIQKRRTSRGRRQLLRVNLANVPRRRGGLGRNGPITPKIAVKTVAANVGVAISGLQSAAPKQAIGSENIGTLITQGVANAFTVVYETSLNPAEPGLVPMLAATANQYQRFRTRALKLTYTPSASTSRDGILYVCVYPNADSPVPTTVDEMASSGNMRQFPIYGQASSWIIEPSSIQAAYKVQTIDVKDLADSDTTLNSAGKLFAATTGAAATIALGTLTWTYDFELTLPRSKQGANSLHSHYHSDSPESGSKPIILSAERLLLGWENLIPTDTAGVYRMRIRQAPHLLVLRTVGASTGYSQEVFTSPDAVTFTAVNPEIAAITDTSNGVESIFRLPPTPYVKIQNDTTANLAEFDVWMTSLRS